MAINTQSEIRKIANQLKYSTIVDGIKHYITVAVPLAAIGVDEVQHYFDMIPHKELILGASCLLIGYGFHRSKETKKLRVILDRLDKVSDRIAYGLTVQSQARIPQETPYRTS